MRKKILIVYYSENNHTKKIADYIAKATDATVEHIETNIFGGWLWGYLKRGWLSYRKETVPIRPVTYDPAKFDLVVIGAPVWAGHLPSPMRCYLREHAHDISDAAFFVTMGGTGGHQTLSDMGEVTGLVPIAALEIGEKDIRTKQDVLKIDHFIALIKKGSEVGNVV